MAKIIPVNVNTDDLEVIRSAAEELKDGSMIILPTETLYGLAVSANDPAAVKRLFRHKNRDAEHAVPLIVGEIESVGLYAAAITNDAEKLMEHFWPGPLTLIFSARSSVDPLLTGGKGTIGIRMSSSKLCRRIAKEIGAGFTATSANISGEPPANKIWDISARLRKACSVIFHGGELADSLPSTVLDVSSSKPLIVREGVILKKEIEATLGKKIGIADTKDSKKQQKMILFICTGNICRSPMAEGILKDDRVFQDVSIQSAGTSAYKGHSAAIHSVEVCRQNGIDISDHKSQPVSEKLLNSADIILAMDSTHVEYIKRYYPNLFRRTHLLKQYGTAKNPFVKSGAQYIIDDPLGGAEGVYEKCFKEVYAEINRIKPILKKNRIVN